MTDESGASLATLATKLDTLATKLDTVITALNLVNTKLAGGLPSVLTTDKLKVVTL